MNGTLKNLHSGSKAPGSTFCSQEAAAFSVTALLMDTCMQPRGKTSQSASGKKLSGDQSQQTCGSLLPKNICCDCQAIYVSEDKLCADINIFPP